MAKASVPATVSPVVAATTALKCASLNAACKAWLHSQWDADSQTSALFTYASGKDSVIHTHAEATQCKELIEAAVTACRAFKLEVSKVANSATLTDQQKIVQISAMAWVAPVVPK